VINRRTCTSPTPELRIDMVTAALRFRLAAFAGRLSRLGPAVSPRWIASHQVTCGRLRSQLRLFCPTEHCYSKPMDYPSTISSFSTTLLISAVSCRVACSFLASGLLLLSKSTHGVYGWIQCRQANPFNRSTLFLQRFFWLDITTSSFMYYSYSAQYCNPSTIV
jgi:hypothetical protein